MTMVPVADEMDSKQEDNFTIWTAAESTDTPANTTVDDTTPFDSSVLGEILAALDYYYIPILIVVGLIGNKIFYQLCRQS